MASTWKHPKSQNLFAKFRGANGKTVNRSTGTPDEVEALRLAKTWELEAQQERRNRLRQDGHSISMSGIADAITRAGRMAQQKRLTPEKMRELINSLCVAAGQPTIDTVSARGWCEGWLAAKTGTVAAVSLKSYRTRCDRWLKFLGKKSELSLDLISKTDAIDLRDTLTEKGLWAGTINEEISFLRSVHQSAVDQGHLARNPFAGIDPLKVGNQKLKAAKREPFTISEVKALLAVAEGDWKGMILLGALTGLRLGDASRLTWKSVDLQSGTIRLTVQKTGKDQMLAIHHALDQWLREQPRGIANAPVFPSLFAKVRGGKNGLCPTFLALVKKAGIIIEMAHTGKGKGRNKSKKTFHSLRHFIATEFAHSNVRAEIARSIVGHADAKTHEGYVSPDFNSQRDAINSIPLTA